jgi:hypothetical protein
MRLTAEDKFEITALLSRYALALDGVGRTPREYDLDALTKIFTSDAVIEGPKGAFVGHEGLRNWTDRDEPVGSWHVMSNIVVEAAAEGAEVKAKFFSPIEGHFGAYRCQAVKIDGTWFLSKRVVKFDEF